MTYRTTLSPQDFATAIQQLDFTYVETSCFCTTYKRGSDLLSVEEPEGETFVDLEIATDFRFTDTEIKRLGITK